VIAPRFSRRLGVDSALLLVAGSVLFVSMFLPWVEHEGLHGPEAASFRSDSTLLLTLNGWKLSYALGIVVLLAVSLAVATVVRHARAPSLELPISLGAATSIAAAVAAAAAGREINAPSHDIYTHVLEAPWIALGAALALVVAGLVSARVRREPLVKMREGAYRRAGPGELGAAVAGLGLFATMFLNWYVPREGELEPVERKAFTAWTSLGWERGVLVLAVIVALAPAAHALLGSGQPLRLVPGAAAAAAGAVAALVVLLRITDPPLQAYLGVYYEQPTTGAYLALACSLAIAVAGLLALATKRPTRDQLVAEVRHAGRRVGVLARGAGSPGAAAEERGEPAARLGGTLWPIVAGIAVLLVLTLAWGSFLLLGALIPTAIGYLVGRWWLLMVPLPLGLIALAVLPSACSEGYADCEADAYQAVGVLGLALVVTVGLAIGVGVRTLKRRADAR
jgi:hypothetical protein